MTPRGGAADARSLERRNLIRDPVIDGRTARDHSLSRFKRRVDALLVSSSEREEVELERRLRALDGVTRPNLIAVMSPKGGVGQTAIAFVVANLLASQLKLRAVAVDGNPGVGTLGRLPAQRVRAERSLVDLLDDADRIGTAAQVRPYVSRLHSGLHVLGAPHGTAPTPPLAPARYGELVAFLSCFYETVVLDLGSGITGPLARLAVERSDQLVLVTTPEKITATLAVHALSHLDPGRTTVVVNRAHSRRAPELGAIEDCLRTRGVDRPVPLPDDRRLAGMLASGTYSLEALDRRTRLAVKRLGLVVAERLV